MQLQVQEFFLSLQWGAIHSITHERCDYREESPWKFEGSKEEEWVPNV